MNPCPRPHEQAATRPDRAPIFVPLALIAAGLALLPYDCVFNRLFALMVIGLGTISLAARTSDVLCCLKSHRLRGDARVNGDLSTCI